MTLSDLKQSHPSLYQTLDFLARDYDLTLNGEFPLPVAERPALDRAEAFLAPLTEDQRGDFACGDEEEALALARAAGPDGLAVNEWFNDHVFDGPLQGVLVNPRLSR